MENITLRKAEQKDSKDIFLWRNDPHTIAASPSGKVEFQDHVLWFTKSLQNNLRTMYIALDKKDSKLGIIRFDKFQDDYDNQENQGEQRKQENQKNVAEISINLNPHFRGKGLAKPILTKALKTYFHDEKISYLLARIIPQNQVSLKLFTNLGFSPISPSMKKDLEHTNYALDSKTIFLVLIPEEFLQSSH